MGYRQAYRHWCRRLGRRRLTAVLSSCCLNFLVNIMFVHPETINSEPKMRVLSCLYGLPVIHFDHMETEAVDSFSGCQENAACRVKVRPHINQDLHGETQWSINTNSVRSFTHSSHFTPLTHSLYYLSVLSTVLSATCSYAH